MTSRIFACFAVLLLLASTAEAQSGRSGRSGRSRTRTTTPAQEPASPAPTPEPAAAPTPAREPEPAARQEREERTERESRASRSGSSSARAAADDDGEGWLKTPARDGMFIEIGAMLGARDGRARPWFRGEFGLGLGTSRLSLVVPVFFTNDGFSLFGERVSNTMTYGLFPGLRYDMTLVSGHGDLSVYAEAGGGFLYEHTRLEINGTNDVERANSFRGGFRIAPGATYIAAFGGMVTLQPFGMTMTFGEGGARALFEMSLMLGYRWE